MRPEEESNQKKRKHRNLMLGSRNSPFPSKWCISLQPFLSKDELMQLIQKQSIVLGQDCTVQDGDSGNGKVGVKFRQRESSEGEVDDDKQQPNKKKRKKRNKNSK